MMLIIILTGIACIFSIILVNLDSKLNRKINEYEHLLPGYNCGACGFSSCEGMGLAMTEDLNNYKKCKPLRGELLKEMEEFVKKRTK